MYTICDPENHPFDLGQTIWFKGGRHAISNPTFCGFKVGDAVTVTALLEDEDGEYVRIAEDAEKDDEDNAPVWNVSWFTDCQSKVIRSTPTESQEDDMNDATTTPRPTVRFDDRDVNRSTARSYANDLISRVNKPETNDVLSTVADGGEVDAYTLAEALLDASRHVATRFGQSVQRRRAGEKVAHLGYIAHAVLASHADGLPAYEPGARSLAVEESKRALVLAREEVEALTRALEARKRETEQVRYDAETKVARIVGAANDEIDKIKAERDALASKLRAVEAEREAAALTIAHVVGRLDDEDKSNVLGYWEGALDALNPSDG